MSRIVVLVLTVGVLWGGIRAAAQEQPFFPHTKQRGRATVEYKDGAIQVVASYDYSQRNHALRWVLVDLALWTTSRRLILERDYVTLQTPTGSRMMVADQRRFLEDSSQVAFVRQNATIWRRQLNIYLSPFAPLERLQFLALPGEGLAVDTALLDKDRVTIGEVFFEMPSGEWETGTYALAINHPLARAVLPITLE
jgi:hypothetical protein